MVEARRRVRATKRGTPQASGQGKRKLKALLTQINDHRTSAAQHAHDQAKLEAELFDLMKDLKENIVEVEGVVAEITTPMGKSSTYIDPKKLRKELPDDKEYYDCIKVGITKVKEYLPQKRVAAISDVTPGKPGTPKLSIKDIKK